MNVRLSPAVRLTPPSGVFGPRWLAENILERRRFKVSKEAAAALIAAIRPRTPNELAARLASLDPGHRSEGEWGRVVEMMLDHGLILDESVVSSDPKIAWLLSVQATWSQFGWAEAADYHTVTFDYPCLDYSEVFGMSIDIERMVAYQQDAPDDERFKLDYIDCDEIPLNVPGTDACLGSAMDVWCARPGSARLDFDNLCRVLEFTFGPTGEYVPRTRSAPLMSRTSPSGGGRHPSEGYVVVVDVPQVKPGWYHVTMAPFGLRRISRLSATSEELQSAFAETVSMVPFPLKAVVVVTSVFERNMYRYREPRTFRTVHMDAGHLAGTVRLVTRALGLASAVYYCDPAGSVEGLLEIDGMREGYMLTVAMGDGASPEPLPQTGGLVP